MKKQKRNFSGAPKRVPIQTSGNNETTIAVANDLFQAGKMRDATALLVKEVLLRPENEQAQALLNQMLFRRNGMMFYREFNQKNLPSILPSISLCMIARNEEKCIAQCLDAFKDHVQEIIVVDTGSTDRTVEIARSYGAEVRSFPWVNDFAAARNVSIQNVKGDWILRMDADEWSEPAEMIKLLNAAASGAADLYFCKTVSSDLYEDDPNAYGVQNLRLFKNHLGLTFEHAIHETVTTSLAIRNGLRTAITNIIFLHSGYDVSEEDMEAKIARNLKICESGLAKDPDDRFLRMVHGIIAYRKAQDQGANEMETACTDLPQETFPSKYLEMSYIFLIQHHARCQNREKVAKFIEEALVDFCSDALMLQYLGEKLLFALGDAGYAVKVLNRALICNPSDMVSDLLDAEYYNPDQIKRTLLQAYVLLGERRFAERTAREVKQSRSKSEANVPVIVGEPSKIKEDLKLLDNALFEAALKAEEDIPWVRLAKLEFQLGRCGLSMICSENALARDPDNQEALNLLGIAALQNKDHQLAQESFIKALILNPSSRNTRENLDNFCTLQGISTAEALFDQGTKWYSGRQYQKAAYAFVIASKLDPLNPEIQKYLELCYFHFVRFKRLVMFWELTPRFWR